MLIQTYAAHNAIWVHPTSEVRLEFDEHPSLGERSHRRSNQVITRGASRPAGRGPIG